MMSTAVSRVVQNRSDSLPAPFPWTVIIAIMFSTGGKGKMSPKTTLWDIRTTFPGNDFPGNIFLGNFFSGKRLSGKVTFRESHFPGNVFSGKRLFRETYFRESDFPGNDKKIMVPMNPEGGARTAPLAPRLYTAHPSVYTSPFI